MNLNLNLNQNQNIPNDRAIGLIRRGEAHPVVVGTDGIVCPPRMRGLIFPLCLSSKV